MCKSDILPTDAEKELLKILSYNKINTSEQ